jgi:hypothetical protein
MHAVETTQKAEFLHVKLGGLKSSHWSVTYDVEMYVLRSIHTGSSRPNYCAVLCHSQGHAISPGPQTQLNCLKQLRFTPPRVRNEFPTVPTHYRYVPLETCVKIQM